MNWNTRKEKHHEHQKHLHDARQIVETALKEKREMTPEENEKWSDLHKQADAVWEMVETLDAQDAAERAFEQRFEKEERTSHGQEVSTPDAYNKAWIKWFRSGKVNAEQRLALDHAPPEIRAASNLNTSDVGHGSEWVPTIFANYVTEALKATGGVREAGATIINQTNGASVSFSTSDDVANKAVITDEGDEATDDDSFDPTTGAVTVKPYRWNSKVLRVHINLLDSAAFNVEQYVAGLLAERIFRGTNESFTTGSGTGAPKGVVTASTLGHTGSSATGFGIDDLYTLKHSVNSSYRRRGARWMFNDQTLLYIKKNLKDEDGRPLWRAGNIELEIPPTIDSDPYVINDDMANIGANAKCVLYGNFSAYHIVDVNSMILVRFNEKYMNALQIGFLAHFMTGGNLVDVKAVKHFKNAAS